MKPKPSEPLSAAKERVEAKFLGKLGIHAVGANIARRSIQLYSHSPAELEKSQVLEEIRRLAAPFPVMTVEEDPPKAR